MLPTTRTLALSLVLAGLTSLATAGAATPDEAETLFRDLAVGATASEVQLVTVKSSYPLIRPTTRGRTTLDVSKGFLDAFPEAPLLAAALAQGISRLDLMARGAPNTETTEHFADEEALLLLARTGRDPASLRTLLQSSAERLGARHPLSRSAARRIAHLEGRVEAASAHAATLDDAYAAMAGGDYASAVASLEPLVEAYPVNPEIRTQLGLAQLGIYYASVRPSVTAVRLLEALPELSETEQPPWPPSPLRILDGGRWAPMLRGQSPPAVRSSGSLDAADRAALHRAHATLAAAYKLLPTRLETLAHLVLVESELRLLGEAAPDLDKHLQGLQRRTKGEALPATVWRTLGLQQIMESGPMTAERLARAAELFTRAGDADSLLNRALLDPAAIPRLALLAPRDLEELANNGGRSPSTRSWPLGATLVEVHSLVPDLGPPSTRRTVVEEAKAGRDYGLAAGSMPSFQAPLGPSVSTSDVREHPFGGQASTLYLRDFLHCPRIGSLDAPRPAPALEIGCRRILQTQTEAP